MWVWVMGEHPDDKPIERIIEDEAKKMAREIAENEVRRMCSFRELLSSVPATR